MLPTSAEIMPAIAKIVPKGTSLPIEKRVLRKTKNASVPSNAPSTNVNRVCFQPRQNPSAAIILISPSPIARPFDISAISKNGRIPDLDALFAGEETKIEYDAKTGNAFIGLSPKTVSHLMQKGFPNMFITRGGDITELRNNYVVSRFLLKVFTETNIYYALKHNSDKNLLIIGDDKFRELFDYVRIGSKDKKVYSYTVKQIKELNPHTDDDFVCSIDITHDASGKLTGMIFKLYEIEFLLDVWNND